MALFRMLSQHFPGGTEVYYENLRHNNQIWNSYHFEHFLLLFQTQSSHFSSSRNNVGILVVQGWTDRQNWPVDKAADEGRTDVLSFQDKVPEAHLLQLILQVLWQESHM